MTALRQSAIAELERVPEDKLGTVINFINKLLRENETRKAKAMDLDQFIMPPTKRVQDAAALSGRCDMFFTNDRQLRQEKELPCMTMEDL